VFRIYLIFITIINISFVIDLPLPFTTIISIMRIMIQNIFACSLIIVTNNLCVSHNIILYNYNIWYFNNIIWLLIRIENFKNIIKICRDYNISF